MIPAESAHQAPVPPPAYHRSLAHALHLDALTLVQRLHLVELCGLAVGLAQRQCPPPLPAGPGGAPRVYREESLLLLALLRTLWRLSYQELHDWLCAWPALACACGLPPGPDGRPRVPSKAQQSKRLRAAGAPPSEMLFVLLVRAGLWMGLTRGRDLIIDSAPILAWRRTDPDAALGHAPAHHPRPLLRGYRLHTLLCRGTGLPLLFLLSPANVHDAPFARPLLELAVRLFAVRPRVVRLDAGYWGLKLIAWIHIILGAVAVIPWNPKRQKRRDGLPPTWTAEELGKRSSIERFFGRVLVFFRLQRPPVFGWSAVETRAALTYAAVWAIALAAWQAGRPDLIRSPRLVLAYVWEGGWRAEAPSQRRATPSLTGIRRPFTGWDAVTVAR
jgi:transposase